MNSTKVVIFVLAALLAISLGAPAPTPNGPAAYTEVERASGDGTGSFFWHYWVVSDGQTGGCNQEKNTYAGPSTPGVFDATNTRMNVVRSGTKTYSGRLMSYSQYYQGVFIFHVKHLPFGQKGWPALWFMNGMPCNSLRWPVDGEIDVIESSYESGGKMINKVALHTAGSEVNQCSIPHLWDPVNIRYTREATDTVNDRVNCAVGRDSNGNWNQNLEGCWFATDQARLNYDQINSNGGGYFALVWLDNKIEVYFWRADDSPPASVTGAGGVQPNPADWAANHLSKRHAIFNLDSSCPSSNFAALNLIIDTKICGSFGEYSQGCEINANDNFDELYWQFGRISYYQQTPTQYLGCFSEPAQNEGSRIFNYKALEGSGVNAASCIAACRNAGYNYAGLQYGNQCWCSNSNGFNNYPSSTACNMPCSTNAVGGVDTCGGAWANNVYKVTNFATQGVIPS